MAPNVLGNTIILTEACIEKSDDNNNSQKISCNKSKSSLNQTINNNHQNGIILNKTSNHNGQADNSSKTLEIPGKLKVKNFVWRNIIAFIYLHTAALYGLYLAITSAKIITFLFAYVLAVFGGLGITAGAHRLWAHKSYKAKWPLRLFLMLCQTLAFQNSIYEWVRDHRVHHKFTDTNADPHNAKRGFFFSHIGWLMLRKHPDVKNKGSTIDMTDLESDAFVMFQKKYYLIMMPIITFIIPTMTGCYVLGDSLKNSWYVVAIFRYTISLNFTWLVNSYAHIWGTKPYDKSISPTNTKLVGILAIGEGWHNYHHVFPWDYKTAEVQTYTTNWTLYFINLWAKWGLAYDLKTVSEEIIQKRVLRTGDGSHPCTTENDVQQKLLDYINSAAENDEHLWGWDDKDMTEADKLDAQILNQKNV
uniref:Putative fatty acid desaturase n=1 Tax=Corethrella appendiculata TaxID=1370023 RepID=U5EY18_9DIPT